MTSKIGKWIFIAIVLIVVIWALITFKTIVAYFVLSLMVAFIGKPLVTMFQKIKIGAWRCPRSLAAILSMLTLSAVVIAFIALIVPQLVSQLEMIAKIDPADIEHKLAEPIDKISKIAYKYGLMSVNIEHNFLTNLIDAIELKSITSSVESFIETIGALIIAVFSIFFISFFFLKDSYLFDKMVFAITPDGNYEKVDKAIKNTSRLLTRYFIGIVLQISLIFVLLFIGLTIVGVQNALLIAFLAGLFNVIPYVGPLIGISISLVLGITSSLQLDFYEQTVPLLVGMLIVFGIVQFLDNFVFQPLIFSNSVKAHPLEIFVVILMSATLGGVLGMVLAIPVYTILRVFAKEFLTRFKLVRSLTKNI